MKFKQKLLFIVQLLLPVCSMAQADIHFSQFYETCILRNPALTGVSENNYKITAYYRNQWNSVAMPYQTYLLDVEYRIRLRSTANDFLSFGILGFSDKAGDLDQKITAVYGAINYNKSISSANNSYLSVGFTGGYKQYSLDLSNARVNNQFVGGIYSASNPTLETFPVPKRSNYDVGAGVSYNFTPGFEKRTTYFLGVSGYHFNQPKFSYYNNGFTENIRWNANAGLVSKLDERYMLQVPVNFALQGTYQEIIFGGLFGWHSFTATTDPNFEIYAGAMYRISDAIVPVVKLRYKNFGIGMSYDVNISSLHNASKLQGGYELTLTLSGNYPKDPEYRMTVCPRF